MDISTLAKNTVLTGATPMFNSGTLQIRTGASPGANVAATGTLLATVGFAVTAFATPVGGIATANVITSDVSTDAAGTVGYCRALRSDSSVIGDLTVSITGGGGEVEFDSLSVSALGVLNLTAMTLTM